MIAFPNCKINLGLQVVGKRPDGYHNLETVFYPLPFYDVLEIIEASEFKFSATGNAIAGSLNDNLCVKAYQILKADHPHLPNVHIHLHKVIPMGAGLGGGSADGAFTLKLLNEKFKLGISKERLLQYALRLGSDCPFFIFNQPCYATGRGEILEEIQVDLSAYRIVLINPGIHVSTKDAFGSLVPTKAIHSLKSVVTKQVEQWNNHLQNDFEKSVVDKHPKILEIKDILYYHGAIYTSMTGTGSTVYGIFDKEHKPKISFPEAYLQFWVQ